MDSKKDEFKGFRPFSKPIKIESNTDLRNKAKTKNWKGKGSKENPFIIESQNFILSKLSITYTNLYIIFRNSEIIGLRLNRCQNILMKDCKLNDLELRTCSNITIQDSTLYGTTRSIRSNKLKLNNSLIYHLRLKSSFNNIFSDCKIPSINSSLSRANIFRNNEIPERVKKRVFKLLTIQDIISFSTVLLIFVFLIYLIFIATTSYDLLILVSIILIVILSFLFITPLFKFLKQIKRAKNYSQNKVV